MRRIFPLLIAILISAITHSQILQMPFDETTYGHSDFSGLNIRVTLDEDDTDSRVFSNALEFNLDLGENYGFGLQDWDYSLSFTIEGYESSSPSDINLFNIPVTISICDGSSCENGVEAIVNMPLDDYEELDYVKLTGFSVSSTNGLSMISDYVRFGLSGLVEKGYKACEATSQLSTFTFTGKTYDFADEDIRTVLFEWDSPYPYDYYEFELLKVKENDITNQREINYKDALHLIVEGQTELELSLLSGSGLYFWRVRPVGGYYSGGITNRLNYGEWIPGESTVETGLQTVSFPAVTTLPSTGHYFEYTQFNEDINWVYSRYFAEGNKQKESISYYTGMNLPVQSQVRMNSSGTVVVSQQAYDYESRPVLQTLPAPNEKKHLGYDPDFFKSTESGESYSATDFDRSDRRYDPVNIDQGSSLFKYYSSDNTGSRGDNRVPTSYNSDTDRGNARPYTRILYLPDGTGRPYKQSLPGENHWLSETDGHDITYSYGAASQSELDYFFGIESPLAENVKRVDNFDNNGVRHTSYYTKDEKLLATVMDDNLDHESLDNISSSETINITLELPESQLTGNHSISTTELNIIPNNSIELENGKPVNFHYNLTPQQYAYCISSQTCDYRVVITLRSLIYPTDPCRNIRLVYDLEPGSLGALDLIPNSSSLPVEIQDPATGDLYSAGTCSNNLSNLTSSGSVNLLPGMYSLTKEIYTYNSNSGGQPYIEAALSTLENLYLSGDPQFTGCCSALPTDYTQDCNSNVPLCGTTEMDDYIESIYTLIEETEGDSEYLSALSVTPASQDASTSMTQTAFVSLLTSQCNAIGEESLYSCLLSVEMSLNMNAQYVEMYLNGESGLEGTSLSTNYNAYFDAYSQLFDCLGYDPYGLNCESYQYIDYSAAGDYTPAQSPDEDNRLLLFHAEGDVVNVLSDADYVRLVPVDTDLSQGSLTSANQNYLCLVSMLQTEGIDCTSGNLPTSLSNLTTSQQADLTATLCECISSTVIVSNDPPSGDEDYWEDPSFGNNPNVSGDVDEMSIDLCVEGCENRRLAIELAITNSVSEINLTENNAEFSWDAGWEDFETIYNNADKECLVESVITACIDQCQYDLSWIDETEMENGQASCYDPLTNYTPPGTSEVWPCYEEWAREQTRQQINSFMEAYSYGVLVHPYIDDPTNGNGYASAPGFDHIENTMIPELYSMLNNVMNFRIGEEYDSGANPDYPVSWYFTNSDGLYYKQLAHDVSFMTDESSSLLNEATLVVNALWDNGVEDTVSTDDELKELNFAVYCNNSPSTPILHWSIKFVSTTENSLQQALSTAGYMPAEQLVRLFFNEEEGLHAMIYSDFDGLYHRNSNNIGLDYENILAEITINTASIPAVGSDLNIVLFVNDEVYPVSVNPFNYSGAGWESGMADYCADINSYYEELNVHASYDNITGKLSLSLQNYLGYAYDEISVEISGSVYDNGYVSGYDQAFTNTVSSLPSLLSACGTSSVSADQHCPYGYDAVSVDDPVTNTQIGYNFTDPVDVTECQDFMSEVELQVLTSLNYLLINRPALSESQCIYEGNLPVLPSLSISGNMPETDDYDVEYYENISPVIINGETYDLSVTLQGLRWELSETCYGRNICGMRIRLGCSGSSTAIMDLLVRNFDGSDLTSFPGLSIYAGVGDECRKEDFDALNFSPLSIIDAIYYYEDASTSGLYAGIDFDDAYFGSNYASVESNTGCYVLYAEAAANISGTNLNTVFNGANLPDCNNFGPTGCTVCMAWQNPETVLPGTPVYDNDETEDQIGYGYDCTAEVEAHTTATTSQHYQTCYQNLQDELLTSYTDKCLGNVEDEFTISYTQSTGHRTYYYYDRAGNLMRTVSPSFVGSYNDASATNPLSDLREPGTGEEEYANGIRINHAIQEDLSDNEVEADYLPSHMLSGQEARLSRYNYNSIGQLTWQCTPDQGEADFWYNALGQLVLSQNSKQASEPGNQKYSYTRYDKFGRPVETGELEGFVPSFAPGNDLVIEELWNNINFPDNIQGVSKSQRTYTLYTEDGNAHYLGDPTQGQRFLRNRVSKVRNDQGVVTCYSYDPHGNVEWLSQHIPGLGINYVRYEYDLISGNVNYVYFNEGTESQFIHKYEYDPDNRIIAVYTSGDNHTWERDAGYEYYKHGPLCRTEIGEDHLQGIDYTYTIEGWLKAINQPEVIASIETESDGLAVGYFDIDIKDPSTPGSIQVDKTPFNIDVGLSSVEAASKLVSQINSTSSLGAYASNKNGTSHIIHVASATMQYNISASGPNVSVLNDGNWENDAVVTLAISPDNFIEDEFMMELTYNKYDYTRAGTGLGTDASYHGLLFDANTSNGEVKPLYDGNIAAWTSNIRSGNETGTGISAMGLKTNVYTYDKLNRFKTNVMYKYTGTDFVDSGFAEAIGMYDGNGNIRGMSRSADNTVIDDLVYHYKELTDGGGISIGIEGNQLEYVHDDPSLVDTNFESQDPDNYDYDDLGNLTRDDSEDIAEINWTLDGKVKSVIRTTDSDKPDLYFTYDAMGNRVVKRVQNSPNSWENTYYVRDAQGNIMSTFTKSYNSSNHRTEIYLDEQSIYGSSRIGVYRPQKLIHSRYGSQPNCEITQWPMYQGEIQSEDKHSEQNLWQLGVRSESLYTPANMSEMDFTGGSGQYGTQIPEITGLRLDKALATGEDTDGTPLFTVFRARAYLPWQSSDQYSMMVYDAATNLPVPVSTTATLGEPGLGEYMAGDVGREPVILQSPANHNIFYIITGDNTDGGETGYIYYHTVDMEQKKIIEVNQKVSLPEGGYLWYTDEGRGFSLAAINHTDNMERSHAYAAVYKHDDSNPQLYPYNKISVYSIGVSTTGIGAARFEESMHDYFYIYNVLNGQQYTAIPHTGRIALGQLQISPRGDELGLSLYQAGEHRINWFAISPTECSLELSGHTTFIEEALDADESEFDDLKYEILSFDYAPESDESNKIVYLLKTEEEALSSVEEVYDISKERDNAGDYIGHGTYSTALGSAVSTKSVSIPLLHDVPTQSGVTLERYDLTNNQITAQSYEDYLLDIETPPEPDYTDDLGVSGSGEVRRGIDGKMYVSLSGDRDLYVYSNPLAATPTRTDVAFASGSISSGGLPIQPHKEKNVVEVHHRYPGIRHYELTDHLGNVRVVFSDRKIATDSDSDGSIDSYSLDVESWGDYYAFGMPMPGRTYNAQGYKFGFNGKEKDTDWTGNEGSHLDFGARIYDSRIGRWMATDPLAGKYPNLSPYVFSANSIIMMADIDGRDYEVKIINNADEKSIIIVANVYTTTENLEDAQNAANNINEFDGYVYTFENKETGKMEEYDIKFQINVIETKVPMNAANNDPIGNSFAVVDDSDIRMEKYYFYNVDHFVKTGERVPDPNKGGVTFNYKHAVCRDSHEGEVRDQVDTHETGHFFMHPFKVSGDTHTAKEGDLMYPSISGGGMNMGKSFIQNILKGAGIGGVNSPKVSDERGPNTRISNESDEIPKGFENGRVEEE